MRKLQQTLQSTKKFLSKTAFFIQYYSKKLWFRLKLRLPNIKNIHLNSFPAVHLKKMDGVDFVFKFAGEILLIILAITVAAGNIMFFNFSPRNDQSYLSSLLASAPSLNPQLAARNQSVITTVASAGFFAPQADASDFVGLSDESAPTPTDETDSLSIVTPDGIVQPNPDSIKSFNAKEIKVYQTVEGDTLNSIAAQNGISPQTIIWANNLPDNTIKPGWFLIIPPIDGIVYKMGNNDTLPDIAKRFSGNLDTIISYNALKDAEDWDPGDIIIVPGGVMPAPPKPKPTSRPSGSAPSSGSYYSGSDGGGHIFPAGYCTWYVASLLAVPNGGDAKYWPANAAAMGIPVDHTPTVGAAVVTNDSPRHGHVAIVTEVTATSIVVSEMNYAHFNRVDTRTIPINSSSIKAYIHYRHK